MIWFLSLQIYDKYLNIPNETIKSFKKRRKKRDGSVNEEEWIDNKGGYINEKSLLKFLSEGSCGERGIRTPGTSRYDGFQDRCN